MIEVIYELGINHNGSLPTAKKMIDVAVTAGCTYVKLQKRTIDLVYTPEELNYPRESPWGTTTRDQKEALEFGLSDYQEIDSYCRNRISWFASPWDGASLQFLTQFSPPFIKIPSAKLTDKFLLEATVYTGIPVILSTGMSTLEDLKIAFDIIPHDMIYAILHCTSTYPTRPEECNVSCITHLKQQYPWTKIGFSNHYPGLMAMVMALGYGAEMIEFHGTLDRTLHGSDQPASIEPQGVFDFMQRVCLYEKMKGDGVKCVYPSEISIMKKLRR
jgi:N-acetylneuraminate synthase